MTITPTAPAPAAVATAGTVDATDATVSGDFMALIQRALADASTSTPATAPGAPGISAESDPESTNAATPDLPLDALGAGILSPVLVVPVLTTAPTAAGGSTTSSAAVAATSAPESTSASTVTTAATAAQPAVLAAPATAIGPSDTGTRDGAAGDDSRPAQHSLTTATALGSTSDVPAAQASPSASPAASAPSIQPAPDMAGTQSIVVPQVQAAAIRATEHTRAADQVTGQVFPEVTSLVSRGDGAHRITMTLSPEALGEVRIVMTVRDGSVHVRLAAGNEARLALIEGSPELSRLLELAGASDPRIVVRDLPTGTAPATGSAGPDLGANLGAGSNQPHDQHAGTRAEHPARDGTNDGTTPGSTGANPPRSIEPVTDTRSAGVDVTM